MEREEAKRRAELYSALANGKTIQIQCPNEDKEYIGVKQSPKVTFPRVNEFDEGSSYRR